MKNERAISFLDLIYIYTAFKPLDRAKRKNQFEDIATIVLIIIIIFFFLYFF